MKGYIHFWGKTLIVPGIRTGGIEEGLLLISLGKCFKRCDEDGVNFIFFFSAFSIFSNFLK